MSTRNRTISQTVGLYVGPSPATGYHFDLNSDGIGDSLTGLQSQSLVKQLQRIQSFSNSATRPLTDLRQFGELAAKDRIGLASPEVPLQFSYILGDLSNDSRIGFTISTGTLVTFLSGILTKTTDEKNYFSKTVAEGNDAAANADINTSYMFGFGNVRINNYAMEASVGNFPKVTIGAAGLNVKVDSRTTGVSTPAINPQDGTPAAGSVSLPTYTSDNLSNAYSTLLPGDITFSTTFGGIGADTAQMNLQSVNISIPMSRTNLDKLGSKYSYSRELNLPINASVTVNALVGDYATGTFFNLVKCNATYDATLTINKPSCSNGIVQTDTGIAAVYYLKAATLDNLENSLDLNGNQTVTLTYTVPISGPQSTTKGIFVSGAGGGL